MATYKEIRSIGKGGMGKVDLVERETDNKKFARKIIYKNVVDSNEEWEKIRRRFLREIRLLSSIKHEGIIKIYDFNETDKFLWYTMPYYRNGSLTNFLFDYKGKLQESINVFKEIANTLLFLHSLKNPIIHRDLNPNNILVTKSGKFILSDFGLSVTLERKTTILSTTQGWGTIGYTSPEQWEDMANADQRADIYSLGIILHVLYSGRLPTTKVSEDLPSDYRLFISRLIRTNKDERTPSVLNALKHLGLIENKVKIEIIPKSEIQEALNLARIAKQQGISANKREQIIQTLLKYANDEDASVEVYMELSTKILIVISDELPEEFLQISRNFVEGLSNSSLPFQYCDPVANRLEFIFKNVSDPDLKADTYAKMIKIGEGHNRFYVMEKFMRMAIGCTVENDINAICNGLRRAKNHIDNERLKEIAKDAKDIIIAEEAKSLLSD